MHHNPVIAGFHPDPTICRVGNDFLLATSSFEYFPGVPLFHSRDLIHWRPIGHALTRESQLNLGGAWSSGGIFAPTLRHHGGVFYLITTNVSGGGHFYVTAVDPAGPWSDPVFIPLPEFDPDLFWDDDGTVYFSRHGKDGIYQCRLDLATGRPISKERMIWAGSGAKGPEGPHLYKIDGTYYLMIAEGGTEYGHMETIARGPTPEGPFEACPHNPILTHRSTDSPIQVTGHGDLVQAPNDRWWMVCLGVRPVGYPPVHHLGRETFLAEVTWRDGWPVVGNNGRIGLQIPSTGLPMHEVPRPDPIDHFDEPALASCWNHLRNPEPNSFSLHERPGYLRLWGTAATLNDMAAPAFVGRRQTAFEVEVHTRLDFSPSHPNQEAGLVIRMNESHHYEIALTRIDGVRSVFVRRTIGRLSAVVARAALADNDPLDLGVTAIVQLYSFWFASPGGRRTMLADGESRYLSTEVAGGFTGVYLAMYATGHGSRCSIPADFDFFSYALVAP